MFDGGVCRDLDPSPPRLAAPQGPPELRARARAGRGAAGAGARLRRAADAPSGAARVRATGAAGVLLARGSLGNPWLFEQLLGVGARASPSREEILAELDWVIDSRGRASRRGARHPLPAQVLPLVRRAARRRRAGAPGGAARRCTAALEAARELLRTPEHRLGGRRSELEPAHARRQRCVGMPARVPVHRQGDGGRWRVRARRRAGVRPRGAPPRSSRTATTTTAASATSCRRARTGSTRSRRRPQFKAAGTYPPHSNDQLGDVLEPDDRGPDHRGRRSRSSTRTRPSGCRPGTSRAPRARSRA